MLRRPAALGLVVCVVSGALSCGTVKDEVAEPVGLRTDILLPLDSEVIEAVDEAGYEAVRA